MKKWIIPCLCFVSAVILAVSFVSGHKGKVYTSIGSTYNGFWFIPSKSAHFNVTFKSPYTGGLTLIDEKGNPLSASKYTVSVDGKPTGPSFSVNNKRIVRIAIKCSKTLSPGKHYIRVRGGGPLITHVYFKHHLNPLLVWLSWLLSLMAMLCLAWFLVLKRAFFPQFKSSQKIFFIPNKQPLIVKMTGARMVVISNVKKSQSVLSLLLTGPIIYKVHPEFTSPLTLLPARGGRMLVKADTARYSVNPNPMPRIGSATITDKTTNTQITIN